MVRLLRNEYHAEYYDETEGDLPANVVEGDTNILETEIVEGDHANKHDGEGQHLETAMTVVEYIVRKNSSLPA